MTGREYYQSVQEKIQDRAYPAEHSYFSQRLFVVYTPRDLADFLSEIIVVAEPAPSRASRLWDLLAKRSSDVLTKKYDELAKDMLVRTVLHRSKLNTIDVMRELDRARGELAAPSEVESTLETAKPFESGIVAGMFGLGGSTSDLPGPSEVFIANPAHEAANVIQLAIENVLAEPDVAKLMRHSSLVLQFMIDALYWISRKWEANEDNFELTKDPFAEYLIQRLKSDQRLSNRTSLLSPIGTQTKRRLARSRRSDLGRSHSTIFGELRHRLTAACATRRIQPEWRTTSSKD